MDSFSETGFGVVGIGCIFLPGVRERKGGVFSLGVDASAALLGASQGLG